ncbi:MAG: hypothetical protein QG650_224 [Patescibacteria group bacterium]|nr:hypothetical protein [Patescibacteria group bacterium]
MKRIFAALLSLAFLLPHPAVFAAGKVAKFSLTVNQAAKVGEAIDLTVKALDKDGGTVADYAGTVYVTVDNDSKATLPYAEGYTFVAADQGQKTFSKGLAFSKAGNMTVSVIDIDDDKVEGVAKVNVTEGDAGPGVTGNEAVTITNPENGGTITGNETDLVGTTKKNSKFQVFLNGTKAGEGQTDDKGAILFKLKGIDQEQNVLEVKVLDGSDKVAGTTGKIAFSVASDKGPQFKSITVQEGTSVMPGTVLHVTVAADAKLKEVSVSLGDSVEVFKEQTSGVTAGNVSVGGSGEGLYVGTLTAPTASGSYPIDVTLTNDLGKKTVKNAAETLTVLDAPKPLFENIKVEAGDKKASFTFTLTNEPEATSKFKFAYGTESGSLTKESVSFEKSKIAVGSGSTYKWYVDGLDTPGKYFFKISALDIAGSPIAGVESDIVTADLSLNAAGKCTIANVSGLKVAKTEEQSVLSWDSIPEALSYNVYKKDASGAYALIENVKVTSYTIHLAKDAVRYDDFAIKAVCPDGTVESADYAEITRVQTGPAQVLVFLSLALGIGYFITRRRFGFRG